MRFFSLIHPSYEPLFILWDVFGYYSEYSSTYFDWLREKNVQPEKIQGKLEQLSIEALRQIDRKQYGYGMKDTGVTQIMKIGIAFYKKQVELVYRMDSE